MPILPLHRFQANQKLPNATPNLLQKSIGCSQRTGSADRRQRENCPMKTRMQKPVLGEKNPPEQRPDGTGSMKIRSILVPLDFSSSSAKALKYAVAVASQFN